MLPRIIAALLALSLAQAFADPHQVRRWTGQNGSTFEGAYMGTDNASGKYRFVLGQGKSVLVDPNNISHADLKWLDQELHPEKKKEGGKGDWIHFLADPELDRSTLPVIDQGDYGSKASDCVPSSFCNFLLWWDQQNYLPIDKKGDFDKKAEYIHSRMARYFRTRNNSGTSMDHAAEGVATYFQRDLGELATFRILTDQDCSPANLKRYAAGANATLLELTYYYGNDHQGGHVVALSHIDANDDLIFVTWGARLRGRLKILEKDVRLRRATTSQTAHKYELEIMNRADLPEWAFDNEVRFEIDPSRRDGLMVIAPYRYKDQGKAFPAPPDPLMQPGPPKRVASSTWVRPPDPTLTPPPLPHKFDQPAAYSRDWKTLTGETAKGQIMAANDQNLDLKIGTEKRTIPIDSLSPEDQGRVLLWRGISGQDPTLSHGRLDYLLTRGDDINYPVHIFLDGTRFRLELPFVKPTRTIIVDTETGAFVVYWDKKKNYIGRLADRDLLPKPPTGKDINRWETLRDNIPRARLSPHPDWPCRVISSPSPEERSGLDSGGRSFQDPAMLFSAVNSPTLTAALKTLLSPPSIQEEGDTSKSRYYGIFSGQPPSNGHTGAADLLGLCRQIHLAPLRLQWTNTFDPNSKYAKYRKPMAGKFSLELTSFIPGKQGEALFSILPEANSLPVGRFRKLTLKK